MSDNVIVHFRQARWEEVAATLDWLAPRHSKRAPVPYRRPDAWLYPEGLNFVILDRYTDYLEENYPEDIEALNARLGGPPSCSLGVEFRRKTRYNVCTIVQFLCLRLLARYPGLVDDLLGEVWSPEEIESGVAKSSGKFMEFYCRSEED